MMPDVINQPCGYVPLYHHTAAGEWTQHIAIIDNNVYIVVILHKFAYIIIIQSCYFKPIPECMNACSIATYMITIVIICTTHLPPWNFIRSNLTFIDFDAVDYNA